MAMHCNWELKKKKKKKNILSRIKIIYVCLFFYIFLFFQSCLSQTHFQLTLSSPHLSVSPSLKTLSSSISQTLTSLSHHCRPDSIPNVTAHQSSMPPSYQPTHFVELPSRWSTLNPHRRSALDPRCWSTSLMLSTFSNSHLSVLLPPLPIHASDPTCLQVSCLCLLHLHAWDFWFGYVCVSINIE